MRDVNDKEFDAVKHAIAALTKPLGSVSKEKYVPRRSLQDLVDDDNKDRAKSAENPLTFLLDTFPLPASLPWATLLSTTLPSASPPPPPNASEKRLDKACLSSFLRKQAKKAANTNLKTKMAIKSYMLVILF